MAEQWRTLNATLRQRREEEPEHWDFQQRAHARLRALQEGFWAEVKPEFNDERKEDE